MAWYDGKNNQGLNGARRETFIIDKDDNETGNSIVSRLIARLRAQFGEDAPASVETYEVERKTCYMLAARIGYEISFTMAEDKGVCLIYNFETCEIEAYED